MPRVPSPAPDRPTRSGSAESTAHPERTAHAERPPRSAHPEHPERRERADIQGLRALAVVAVIANHLVGWPTGGFVGVDVFFVISGFLITDLLLRGYERDGRIALARFYGRRIRRIVPGALAVLVVTVVVARLVFNTSRAQSVLTDAGWAAAFLANVHFQAVGTDYFQSLLAASPLQHFWSLSVEEQFYVVWPGLLAIVLAVAAGARREGARTVVGVVAAGVVLASFWWAGVETAASPTSAYFDTLARAWELGAGALVAALAPRLARLPDTVRIPLGGAGLAAILVALIGIGDATAFPAPWAALPVVGTALVIAGGVAGSQRALVLLENPVSGFLGRISYSLYLWHLPVIAVMLVLAPTQNDVTLLVVAGLIVLVAVVGYYLVEQPFHRSPLFDGGDPETRRAAWAAWRGRVGGQATVSLLGIGVIALVIVLVTGGSLGTRNPLASAQDAASAQTALETDLASALTATTWPTDLSPSMDDAISTGTLDNPAKNCFDPGATPASDQCTWGLASAPHRMYLVGDSTALAYAPAFKAIAEASAGQWRITTVGLFGCRFADVLVHNDTPGVMDSCAQRKTDVAARIAQDHPDLVVVSNAFTAAIGADGSPLTVGALVDSTISAATAYGLGDHIVYLAPPPLGADLGQCYSPVTSPQSCTVGVDSDWGIFLDAFTARVGASRVISSLPYTCVDGSCPAFAGTTPIRFDTTHFTTAYSVRVAPAIRTALEATGLLG